MYRDHLERLLVECGICIWASVFARTSACLGMRSSCYQIARFETSSIIKFVADVGRKHATVSAYMHHNQHVSSGTVEVLMLSVRLHSAWCTEGGSRWSHTAFGGVMHGTSVKPNRRIYAVGRPRKIVLGIAQDRLLPGSNADVIEVPDKQTSGQGLCGDQRPVSSRVMKSDLGHRAHVCGSQGNGQH